jgi:hypothetical protein
MKKNMRQIIDRKTIGGRQQWFHSFHQYYQIKTKFFTLSFFQPALPHCTRDLPLFA